MVNLMGGELMVNLMVKGIVLMVNDDCLIKPCAQPAHWKSSLSSMFLTSETDVQPYQWIDGDSSAESPVTHFSGVLASNVEANHGW